MHPPKQISKLFFSWLLIILASILFSLPSSTAVSSNEPPTGLNLNEWSKIQSQIRKASYHINQNKEGNNGLYSALNQDQGLRTTFHADKVQISPDRKSENPAWKWNLKLTGYGYGDNIQPALPAEMSVNENRLEYRRGDITEWYVNDGRGIEQGFTLLKPPGDCSDKPLRIEMSVETGLIPKLAKDKQSVLFTDESGKTVLKYHKLFVEDALGKNIPAQLFCENSCFGIVFDDSQAVYPLIVDPIIDDGLPPKFFPYMPPYDGDNNMGYSVSASGDIAVVGVPYDDIGDKHDCGSVYVYEKDSEDQIWINIAIIRSDQPIAHELFGFSVSINENTIFVGAPGMNGGAAYVFEKDNNNVWKQKKIFESNSIDEQFGYTVSVSGDTFIVGAPYSDNVNNDNLIEDCGAVYIFDRSQEWVMVNKFYGEKESDKFGFSVSVDENILVVGSPNYKENLKKSGAAYIFIRNDNSWHIGRLLIPDYVEDGALFGYSVSVNNQSILVGSPGKDHWKDIIYFHEDCGAVYLYKSIGSDEDRYFSPNENDFNQFGYSVYLSDNYFAIGEPGYSNKAGGVYVYDKSGNEKYKKIDFIYNTLSGHSVSISNNTLFVGSPNDSQVIERLGSFYSIDIINSTYQKHEPSIVNLDDAQFGRSVAIEDEIVVIGSPYDDDFDDNSGAVYFINKISSEKEKLFASDASMYAQFGCSVSISGDTAVVGACGTETTPGSAYVFQKDQDGKWIEEQKLSAGEIGDQFGCSVSIGINTIIIGAVKGDADNGIVDTGVAYIYEKKDGIWKIAQKLQAKKPKLNGQFGNSVSIDGNVIVVGAPNDDCEDDYEFVADTGSAYIYVKKSDSAWEDKQKIISTDIATGDRFGCSVSINGNRIAVGAEEKDLSATNQGTGSAYLFELDEEGKWNYEIKLNPQDLKRYNFGSSISIYGDKLAVGENSYNSNVHIFDRNSGGINNWGESDSIHQDNVMFGYAIAFHNNNLVIGAPGYDYLYSDSGAVYLYDFEQVPYIDSITLSNPLPESNYSIPYQTNQKNVSFLVKFSQPVDVDTRAFSLIKSEPSFLGTIVQESFHGVESVIVTVNGIEGKGTLGLNLNNCSYILLYNPDYYSDYPICNGNLDCISSVNEKYEIDTIEPSVTNVTALIDGNKTYKTGEIIPICITFNEEMKVVKTENIPRIKLDVGDVNELTSYAYFDPEAETNNYSLIFNYTIQEGDSSEKLDYASKDALEDPDGAIQDLFKNTLREDFELFEPGSSDSLSGNKLIIIDTTPPNAPVVTSTILTDEDEKTSEILTNDTTPNWSWQSGGGDGSWIFRFKLNDSDLKTGATITSGSFFEPGRPLDDSSYTLYVQERDEAGNWSESGYFAIVIDTDPPEKPEIEFGGSSPTNNNFVTWTWNSSNDPESKGTEEFRFKLNDTNFNYGTTNTTQTTYTASNLPDGTHTLFVQERDELGNWSEYGFSTVIIDTFPPVSPFVSGKALTNNTTPTWTWRSVGGGSGIYQFILDENSPTETTETEFTPENPLTPGNHTLFVKEKDEAGNWSAPAGFTIFIDTESPQNPVIWGNTPTNSARPSWNWSSGGGGYGYFRYSLNNDSWSIETPLTTFKPVEDLSQGEHTLAVQERDEAGNWSGIASYSIIIDTTLPNPPIVTGTTPTNDQTPAWTWNSGGSGSGTYRYKLNNSNLETGYTQTESTRFSPDLPLADGNQTFYVQERDEAGNWSATGSFTILIDTLIPLSPIVTGPESTSDLTPEWVWTSGGGGSGIFRYKLNDSNLNFGTIETSNTSFIPEHALSQGIHWLYVQERDQAGNWSWYSSFSIEIDSINPRRPPQVDGITPVSIPRPTWTWISGGDGIGVYRYRLDDNDVVETEMTSFTPVKDLPEGRHYLYVQESDNAGNWSDSGYAYIDIDLSGPGKPVVSGASPTDNTIPTWTWVSGGKGNGMFRYKLNNSDLSIDYIETDLKNFTPETPLSDGSHILYVQECDNAGNWSEPGQKTIMVDTSLPEPPKFDENIKLIQNNKRPEWSWTSGSGGSGLFHYRLNNDNLDVEYTETRDTRYIHESELPEGNSTLYILELDEAGNPSAVNSLTINIDTGSPCSTASSPTTVYDQIMTGKIAINYTVKDFYNSASPCNGAAPGSGVEKVELWIKGPGDTAYKLAADGTDIGEEIDGVFEYEISAQGTWYFYTKAFDKAGNIETPPDDYDTRTIYSSDFAGYAILAVGSVANREGLESHTKTASTVYRHLLNRNFMVNENGNHWHDSLDHVKFFTPYNEAPVTGKDDYSLNPEGGFPKEYWDAMHYTLTVWAIERMKEIPGPLNLILLDHGSDDTFFLDGLRPITAAQLNQWLTFLENELENENFDFTENPITIFIGTCFSGSFIDNLAKPGRIIVTSTSADEVSYRGPLTPGLYRDGEFFISSLFNELGKGEDLFHSFERAVELTENHTDSGIQDIKYPYFDNARQHPNIEADGIINNAPSFGTHDIGYGGDSDAVKGIFIGYGEETTPLEVTSTGKQIPVLSYETSSTLIWAKLSNTENNPKDIKVWAEIREPGKVLEQVSKEVSQTVDLKSLGLTWNPEQEWYEATYNYFLYPGKYTIFFYAMNTDNIISHPVRTYVYKMTGEITPGDVNGIEGVNLADAVLILKTLAGITTEIPVYKEADVNKDEKIGLEEVIYILQEVGEIR